MTIDLIPTTPDVVYGFKGIVHPNMTILSSFTRPHVIPNP